MGSRPDEVKDFLLIYLTLLAAQCRIQPSPEVNTRDRNKNVSGEQSMAGV
jgi:hypothetical protein